MHVTQLFNLVSLNYLIPWLKKKPFNLQSNFHHKRGHKSECTIVCSYQRFKGDKQFTDRIRKPPSHYIIFPPGFIERLAKVSKNTTSTNPLQFRKFENEKKNLTIWKQRGVYFWAIAEYFPSKNQIQGLLTRLRKLAPPYTCVCVFVRACVLDFLIHGALWESEA